MKTINVPPRDCAECGVTFHPRAANHLFCAAECRKVYQKRVRSAMRSETKNCARCKNAFTPKSNRQIYCSRDCKQGVRKCEECGKEFNPSRNAAGRFCSRECNYESLVPTGTVRVSGYDGYAIVKVAAGTPGTRKGVFSRWMFEHRLVMQQKLGRPLAEREKVHHINGIRHDNRPENLELWQYSHPPGQRKTDLLRRDIMDLSPRQRKQLREWLNSIED